MLELSGTKKTAIASMYFRGSCYDEIATKNNVSKASVANIVSDIKAGLFPEAAGLGEEIDLLREAATDLKQARLTPVQAIVGLSLLSTLNKLNIEPSELDKFQSLIKTFAAPGTDVPALVKAALALDEVQKTTGLSVPELEAKAASLREEVAKLGPLANEFKNKKKELAQTQDTLEKVTAEVQESQPRQRASTGSLDGH